MKLTRTLLVLTILTLPTASFAAGVDIVVTGSSIERFEFHREATPDASSGKTSSAIFGERQENLFEINVESFFNSDPFIQYALGVQNLTDSSLNFLFTFSTTFVGGPYSTLLSTHDSTVTGNTVAVDPYLGSLIHRPQIDGVATSDGDFGDGCTVANTSTGVACDSGNGTFAISPTGSTGVLGVQVGFTLSAGDLFEPTGRAEISNIGRSTVPEPSSMLVLALFAVTGIVLNYWRRRRHAIR